MAVPSSARVRRLLLAWYRRDGRALPWRLTTEPYAILVSELMLQQTPVARVVPRYEAWLDRFPTLAALADAPTGDVLRQWQGLGYNRRALALQRCAQAVVADGGALPQDDAALRALPGIGPYTAAALRCFAFGQPIAPLDVNLLRVLHRLQGHTGAPPRTAAAGLRRFADDVVHSNDPPAVANALMDLGATICTARAPQCGACPLMHLCPSSHRVVIAPRRRAGASFVGSDRQLRGRLLAAVVAGPHRGLSLAAIHRRWPLRPRPQRARLATLAKALEADGLLQRRSNGRGVHLQLPKRKG